MDRPVRSAPGALARLVPQVSDPPGQRGEAHLGPGWRTGQSAGLPGSPEDRHGQTLLLQQDEGLPLSEEARGQQQTPLSWKNQGPDTRLHRRGRSEEATGVLQTTQPALLPDGWTGLWLAVTWPISSTWRLLVTVLVWIET